MEILIEADFYHPRCCYPMFFLSYFILSLNMAAQVGVGMNMHTRLISKHGEDILRQGLDKIIKVFF